MPPTVFHIEVNPQVPQRLLRLEELANNLWYSWDSATRALFSRVHPGLWHAVGHSPKAFLKRVDQQRLVDAADDPVFLGAFNRALSAYDTYHNEPLRAAHGLRQSNLVAYFCAEFGLHESLPIYSGGLGILAGDHCKAASDLRLPFVGVGLLYRQGYFHQTIDGEGRQHAVYSDSDFDDLPILPATRDDGSELRVAVGLPGRDLQVKVWQVRVGHITIYLLDTDLDENTPADRDIAHRLYGGDGATRIQQEIVLGVGGVRALQELGVKPTVWHINEGHAAFLTLERARGLVRQGVNFEAALEAVAANTVFTTHTPVPAGHDHFPAEMIGEYFEGWCREAGITPKTLVALGRVGEAQEFNMTALAIRASRYHNGVSRIHGEVSSRICASLWPEIDPSENPISYITNSIHVPTFLAPDWHDLFERHLGHGWSQRLTEQACWDCVPAIPDQPFWSVHQSLKSQMLHLVRYRIAQQHARNHGSESHLDRILRLADPANPNVLTIGFARRFATYKRATLLFEDLEWLREIVCDAQRPVLLLFAGKAHPADQPSQDLIRRIVEIGRMREFESHVLLVEGHDLQLARRLVSGVDVWLNNPVHPLEASGTSGMKAGINGVINLSVLDGWWGEGYDGRNGWAIKPASSALDAARRNQEESRTLYEILQDSVVPLYYDRGPMGFSPGWVAMAKRSIASLMPRFNSTRMLNEYVDRFYVPAAVQWRRYAQDDHAGARTLAAWKAKVRASWEQVSVRRLDQPLRRIQFSETMKVELAVNLAGLDPRDVAVELLFGRPDAQEARMHSYEIKHAGPLPERAEQAFVLELTPELSGKIDYRIRVYPRHELLTHRFEMGMMKWL